MQRIPRVKPLSFEECIQQLHTEFPDHHIEINQQYSSSMCRLERNWSIAVYKVVGNFIYYSHIQPSIEEAVNDIRRQKEADLCPDMCAYCGQIMDGESCYNLECEINLPEAA